MMLFAAVIVAAVVFSCNDDKNIPLVSLSVNPSELFLEVGDEAQLQVTYSPSNAKPEFKWFASDINIVTVSSTGLVKKIAKGDAEVTVIAGSKRTVCNIYGPGLFLSQTQVYLGAGKTIQLNAEMRPADATTQFNWKSSNTNVAKVDSKGLVTYVSNGTAQITVTSGEFSAFCTVICTEQAAWDFRTAISKPLSNTNIYSKKVLLYANRRVMQGFDILEDGTIYYSQLDSDGNSVIICKASGASVNVPKSEYMRMRYFGHGTQIVAEEASDGVYIWLNSNATKISDGYGNNWSVSRVKYQAGMTTENYAGETFLLNRNNEYDQQVSIDFAARRFLLGTRKAGDTNRYFWVFDLDEILNLPKKDIQISVNIEGATSKYMVRGRDLSTCNVLGNFSIPKGIDKNKDIYSYPHQGHAVLGDYIYFYEGNAIEDGVVFNSKAYLTVFDYFGNIIIPRTEVAAVADRENLSSFGLTNSGYAEAEGLKVVNGKLYLGVACRDSDAITKSDRWANILVYDGVLLK